MMIKEHFWNSASCFIKKFEIQFQKKQNAIIFFFLKSFISIYLIYAENIRNIMRISQDFLFLWSLKHKRVYIIQIYSIEKNIRVLWQRLLIGKWNNFFRILVVTKNKLYFLFQLMESGICFPFSLVGKETNSYLFGKLVFMWRPHQTQNH